MYYSYENCLEKKALFNFITGERGNGKTYGFKTQIACKNYFEKDIPAPKDAPVDADGKWIPLPAEAIEVGITELGGLAVLVKSILQCIGISKKQEVEAEPVEGTVKNAETTQGR